MSVRIYSEKYPSKERDFAVEGFRDGDSVTVKIVETVNGNRIVIPQFSLSADINVIHDANIYGIDAFKEMVESAKQTILNVDMILSDKEANILNGFNRIHLEDRQGADGNMYRIKIFKEDKKITAAINLLSSLNGKEDEINVRGAEYPLDTDIHEILEIERMKVVRMFFSIK